MVTRVVLCDSHEVARRGLRQLLDATGDLEVVGEAATAEAALARIAATGPRVAVLESHLPDGSGIDLCRTIRAGDPAIACLIVSAVVDERTRIEATLAGAAGYLSKRARGNQLVEAVREVADGGYLFDDVWTGWVIAQLRGDDLDPRLACLSHQERRTLVLLADGLTNREIAQRLGLAEKTVKNYVSNLLTKLGMQRRSQAAIFYSRLEQATKDQIHLQGSASAGAEPANRTNTGHRGHRGLPVDEMASSRTIGPDTAGRNGSRSV